MARRRYAQRRCAQRRWRQRFSTATARCTPAGVCRQFMLMRAARDAEVFAVRGFHASPAARCRRRQRCHKDAAARKHHPPA